MGVLDLPAESGLLAVDACDCLELRPGVADRRGLLAGDASVRASSVSRQIVLTSREG